MWHRGGQIRDVSIGAVREAFLNIKKMFFCAGVRGGSAAQDHVLRMLKATRFD
jgi:hypothetical protein